MSHFETINFVVKVNNHHNNILLIVRKGRYQDISPYIVMQYLLQLAVRTQ